MFLEIDEQTIADLRIFGKQDTSGIYDQYNHTCTRGGEARLQEMFRKPLADELAINRRSRLISAFARLRIDFPFESGMFDMVEKYLLKDHRSQPGSLGEKEIYNGVTAVISLTHRLSSFLQLESVKSIIEYQGERETIEQLLADAALSPLLHAQPGAKLSYAALTAFDVLLRGREREKIESLLRFIYDLDVYLAIARVASNRGFVFPLARPKGSGVLLIEGVYHPELPHAVANDLYLSPSHCLVFLTGANMAGKSTFLRSIGTALYIAHMGFPVPAKQMEFSVMDGMFTTINLPDNLGIGASHFYAEVLRVKQVAAALQQGKSLFVIFDELFRGTNVKDAYEATIAISAAFSGKRSSKFIISSHIVEAAGRLSEHPSIIYRYLPTYMDGSVPRYTYRLQEGVTDDRHGMLIIQNEHILDILRNGRNPSRVSSHPTNFLQQ